MRRARISIRPNVRPGGRSVGPAAEGKSGQESTALDDTQQIESFSLQSQPEVKESAVARGDGNVPGSPSEKASLNTNDRAPSIAKIPATPAQRRTRLSATPNLSRPKVRSADPPVSAEKSATLPSKSSKTSSPLQTPKTFPQSPVVVGRDDSQNSKLSDATTGAHCSPKSPSSTQSHQNICKTPLKIPRKDVGPQEGAIPDSCAPYLKLSRVDGPGSPLRDNIISDKERVLRALKLKELMKLERRKESMKQNGRRKQEHYQEMDRDKMTIADFIYYLPETNPMKSSLSTEETQTAQTTTVIPQSPMVQKKITYADEDDEEEEDDDDDVLVPKVKVAEDGSLILDEESLTVRVQRTSDTVVENANPLFERGSTTTYRSFRKYITVKTWSVRETDMFYLAISMVGTDFSMMAQLLTHRDRAEIKRKFRKEERENSWRVDKAFRDKRPYDAEFFSFLLKRILAKDKEKGKAIKLVVKSSKTRKRKGKGGKKAKEIVKDFCDDNDDCDEVCSVDSVVSFDLEKENEDSINVKKDDVPPSKKRKCKKKEKSCVKKSKSKKTTRKGKFPVEDEDSDIVCGDNDLDSVDADIEDQPGMSVLKKKCKQSKKGDREEQKEKPNGKEKHRKKNKKTLKVQNEEPAFGESEVNKENSEASTVPTKKRMRSKKCAREDEEPTLKKMKTKKNKTSQEVCIGDEVSATAASVEGEELSPESTSQKEISQSSSKFSKIPLNNLLKRKAKKCIEPNAAVEHEDAVEGPEDEIYKDAVNQSRILHLAEEQLQSQPVVILKRTLPREELNPDITAEEDIPQSSSKRSKRPLPNLLKRKSKKCNEPKAAVEHEDAVEKPEDETFQDAENESKILHIAEEPLQNQPVVILERTPSREELNPDIPAQEEISQSSTKRSKRSLPSLLKIKTKICTESKVVVEHEEAVEEPEDENLQFADNESRILHLAEEQLQNQPVVILERTPSREELNPDIPAQEEISQSSTIRSKRSLPSLLKIKTKICTESKVVVEHKEAVEEPEDETLQLADNESRILHLAEEQLQNQPVVILERTPTKLKDVCNSPESKCEPLSPKSPQQSPGRQLRAKKVKRNLNAPDDGSTDLGCKENHGSSSLTLPEREKREWCSDKSVEDMSSTAMPEQVVSQDSEVIEEGFNLKHLELNSSGVKGQTSLKRAVVSVSHQEVEHYLRIQTQSKAEESTSSDTTPARGHYVGKNRESSTVTVFQVPEIKEPGASPISAQQSIAGTRRRILKPRPSLSQPAQSSRRPEFSKNSLSLKHDSMPLECTNSVEDQVKLTANENLEVELRDHEEEDTQRDSPEENITIDVKGQDDDSPSLTSVDVPEKRTGLKKTPSQMSKNEDQLSDQESENIDDMMSWMNDEALYQFDPGESSEHQRSMRDQHCDLVEEPFSLVSSVVDLQQCKQNKDVLCPVPLLSSTQTPVPVDSSSAKSEKNNPVFSHASSLPIESLGSSFSDHPTQHTSNLYVTDSVPAVENTQIAKQDSTEEQLLVFENWSAPLNGNSKSDVSNSAEVETGADDIQSEEEPTFILTLYEIPTSQFFNDAVSGQQDTLPYDLQPAQIQTPSLLTGSSQSLTFTIEAPSASQQTASEELEIPCESVSHTDDSLVPFSKDPTDAKDTRIQLTSSQESCCDGVNTLISASVRLSCSSAMPTDVPNLNEIKTKTSETKAPTERSKKGVKPKLKHCVKAGPSKNEHSNSAHSHNLPSSSAKPQTEAESNQKTSAWETVDPNIFSSPKDSERRDHPGHDGVVSVVSVPVSEEIQVKIPFKTDDQTEEDSIDLPVQCRSMKESMDETDGGCEGVSHMGLADAFMFSPSGEMDNVFKKEIDNSPGGELQEPIDLSWHLPERDKFLPSVIEQKEKIADTPENLDTCKMASSELSSTSRETLKPFRRGKLQVKPKIPQKSTKENFSRQEQSDIEFNDPATAQIISPVPLIKDELEERTEQEDFSEEELDTGPVMRTLSSQDLSPFTSKNTSVCTDSPPVELKIEGGHEDVRHTVLCDIFVPVSNEIEDDSLQMGELSQQSLHEEETQSHLMSTDILAPVCEDVGDDLSQDWRTTRERTSHKAERPKVREKSQSSPEKSSSTPKWNRPAQRKGKFLVKMTFPKRKTLPNSPNGGEQSQAVPLTSLKSEQEADATLKAEYISEPKLASAHCSVENITSDDLLLTGSESGEVVCGGVSHLVLSDFVVPVWDDSAKQSLNKEASSAGLQADKVKTQKLTASPTVSVEWKTPSCRRATLCPKPNLSKRIDDPSQTDIHISDSAQTSLATTQSLGHQAEEWSLKSNMLPVDSDEIENWCEGVSHMLLSDAFVPVFEEIREGSTNLKVFSSSPHKNKECAPSPSMERKSDSGNLTVQTCQTDTTADVSETKESRPARQAKKSPMKSNFQMTLRSPERRLKDHPHLLKSPKAASTTPQRSVISEVKKSVGSPTRQHIEEISNVCKVQLERLSVEEICVAQSVLQPKHHSTPVTVKTTSRGNEVYTGCPALLGSRSPGFKTQAEEESRVPPGFSPKVVLQRIPVTETDINTCIATSTPSRVPTGSRTPADQQSPLNSSSGADADKDPVQVSQFFLDDIFTEVVDAD